MGDNEVRVRCVVGGWVALFFVVNELAVTADRPNGAAHRVP